LLDTCQQSGIGFDDVETKTPKTSDRKGCSVCGTAGLAC